MNDRIISETFAEGASNFAWHFRISACSNIRADELCLATG